MSDATHPVQPIVAPSSMYRPDIDGLRGIAIIAAICFHAGFPGAEGGFAGIEIFFVVSGFVITRMILDQQAREKFRLGDFYVRRILRLVPATTPVLVATTLTFAILMTPQEYAVYARSATAMALFYANFFFYYHSGYFDPVAEDQPLLHSWSLSVEEQFYLLWPVAMLVLARRLRPPAILALVGTALVASLLLMLWLHPARANAAFYMLPPRMWEFFAGIAVAYCKPLPLSASARSALSWAGLILLIGFLLTVRPAGGYPNWTTIVPVLATAALIVAGDMPAGTGQRAGAVTRMLGNRWLVGIGLISYSLYLWHWPILTAARFVASAPLTIGTRSLLMLATIPIAWASWRWVEQPLRHMAHHRRAGRIAVAVLAGSISLVLALVLVAREVNRGLGSDARVAIVMAERAAAVVGGCHGWNPRAVLPDCRRAPPRPAGEWLLVGDSQADALSHGLTRALNRRGIALTHLTQSSCPVGLGFEVSMPEHNSVTSDCAASNRRILDEIARPDRFSTIVLASQWPIYGTRLDRHGVEAIPVADGVPVGLETGLRAFVAEVRRRRGRGIDIVIVGPLPLTAADVPLCVERVSRVWGSSERCLVQPSADRLRDVATAQAMLRRVAQASGARLVDAAAPFCKADTCRFGDDKALWWRDERHSSEAGSAMIAAAMMDQLKIRTARRNP